MFSISASRSFLFTSSRRFAVSASARYNSTRLYTSTMHENDPEVLEREKKRNLSRSSTDKTSTPYDYAPGWNEVLATASEAAVKADHAEGSVGSDMQSKTVEFLRAARTETEGESSTTAFYARDEVSGPLRSADGKEEVIATKGKVTTDKKGADTIIEELEEDARMTPSEQDVKADRGEI